MHAATWRISFVAVVFVLVACSTLASAFPEATPGMLHSTLLKGVLVNPTDGSLRLDQVQAMHLPEPPAGGYEATAQEPARQLWAILATKEGAQLARFNFTAEKLDDPLWLLPYNTVTLLGDAAGQSGLKLPASDYVLDFYLSTGKFYSFAFAVKVVDGKVLSTGTWNAWGYLLYANSDPEQGLIWKIFLRRHETGDRDGVAPKVEIVREADKKPIATSRPDLKLWLNDKWTRYDLDLIHPMQGTGGGAYLQAKVLLASDGAYVLKMSMDGAPYGVWPFKVAGGKLQLAGQADRETADPLTYVCGGADAYWYQSQAAAQVNAGQMTAPERTFTQKGFIPDCKAIVVGGTTLAMVGPVVTFLEAQSQWNAPTKTLAITHNDRTLKLTLGNATAQGNAGPVPLGVAPLQKEGDFYAPIKAVAQALGAEVTWDAQTRLLMVIDGDRAGLIHVP
jgi:hypothetical protein